jgi:hypothetical protein
VYDVHGCQDEACKIIKELNNAGKDAVFLNLVPLHQWE